MPTIIKLIKLWAIGRALTSRVPIVRGLARRLAAILVFSIIISVLVAASIAGLIDFTYHELLLRGVARYAALGIVSGIMLAVLASLGLAAWICARQVRSLSRHILTDYAPLSMRISKVAHSFIDGLLGTESDRYF